MNLQDLVDKDGLQQDDWSVIAPVFGKDGQVIVVGWCGRQGSGGNKYYILKCDKCSKDSELFGDGYFKSTKGNLARGGLPCSCSGKVNWTREQYYVKCSRVCIVKGYTFLGFVGEWKGKYTKIKMSCEKHGEWSSGVIDTLITEGCGCPNCKSADMGIRSRKPDSVMVQYFLGSGGFSQGTHFWRSDRLNSKGFKVYWCYFCPDCCTQGESAATSLKLGQRSCECLRNRQLEAYINVIYDKDIAIGLKFCVSNNSVFRVSRQNHSCVYDIKLLCYYKFPTVSMCRMAELECKRELDCGIISKTELPDGYTETTWVYNLERIMQIYERNGGVKNEADW